MNLKLKKILISFFAMMIIGYAIQLPLTRYSEIIIPQIGLLYVLGLLFGPYGALGATSANIIINLINGYTPVEIIPSAIFSFGVSYLSFKLWYTCFKTNKITKPRLDNIYHLTLFLLSIIVCGLVYSAALGGLTSLIYGSEWDEIYFIYYSLHFTNFAFIFGILGIWLSKKIDFIDTPKISKRKSNEKFYQILLYLLIIISIISAISLVTDQNTNIIIGEILLIGILLFSYLTKPFNHEIQENNENTITEKILQIFLIITLTIAISGIILSIFGNSYLSRYFGGNTYLIIMPELIITDMIIILFFIPGIIILRYIEKKILKPISSFSEIERFIRENEKIESDGLLKMYSEYINEKNEIGILARSHTELISYNNQYIENIREIEGEKERINTELDIARRIQISYLPTEAIENEDFIINGYSYPAKEVGGDFLDYYMIDDENLAIIIGDASGKGVPAALIAMITQFIISQILEYEKDPSKVLYKLNNKLCKHNSESMFLTSWLGIYNKTTNRLTFSNAGHNPPIVKENGEFKYLNIDTGLALGVMEDYEYLTEEITLTTELELYTDGITDANNENEEMYGEDRLLNFFNEFKSDANPIKPLIDDVHKFTKNTEQYDDMTMIYFKIKRRD